MIGLNKLRHDLRFVQDLGDVVDAFETAALAQFRIFQNREKPNSRFVEETENILEVLAKENISSTYFREHAGKTALMVVTSDEGFTGELNTLLINALLDERSKEGGDSEIIVLGERGARYLEDINEDFVFFPGVSEGVSYKEVRKIRRYILEHFALDFKRVIVIYPEFLSLTIQKVKVLDILPYSFTSKKGVSAEHKRAVNIEPNINDVLDEFVRLDIGSKLFDIFFRAKQSEYAARIMHLEGSTQELNRLTQKLTYGYFKQIHALSNKSIREISASKILLKKRLKSQQLIYNS